MGESRLPGVLGSVKGGFSGETRGEVEQVEEDPELPLSGEDISKAGRPVSSLAAQEDEDSRGLGAYLNEKRKG